MLLILHYGPQQRQVVSISDVYLLGWSSQDLTNTTGRGHGSGADELSEAAESIYLCTDRCPS